MEKCEAATEEGDKDAISAAAAAVADEVDVFLNCINSPSTRFEITVARSSTTSRLRSLARATEARASKKSPARIAILFPYAAFADGFERRESDSSMTSSWRREAVWIISVISASLRCVGKISESFCIEVEFEEGGRCNGSDSCEDLRVDCEDGSCEAKRP